MAGPISEEEEFEFRYRAEQEAAAGKKRKPAAAPKEQGFFNKLGTGITRLPALVGLNKDISPGEAWERVGTGAAEGLMATTRGFLGEGGVFGKTGEDLLINAPLAAIGSVVDPGRGGFNEQFAGARAQGKRLAKEQPVGKFAGNVGSFITAGGAVRNALPAAWQTGTKLMAEGGILGAASALSNQRPQDVFRDATIGAAIGRVTEPVSELVGTGLAAGAQKAGSIINAIRGKPQAGPLTAKTVRAIANRTKSSAEDIKEAYEEFVKYNPGKAPSFAEIADTQTIERFADMARLRRAVGDDKMGAIYRDFDDKVSLARPENVSAAVRALGPTEFAPTVREGLEEGADAARRGVDDLKVSELDDVAAEKAQRFGQIDEITESRVAARTEARVAEEDAIKLDRKTKIRDLEKATDAQIAARTEANRLEVEDIKLDRDAQIAQIDKAAEARIAARKDMSVEEKDAIKLDRDAKIAAISKTADQKIAARKELQLDEADDIRRAKEDQISSINKAADEQISARKGSLTEQADDIRLTRDAEIASINKAAAAQIAARKNISVEEADAIKLSRDNQIAEVTRAAKAQTDELDVAARIEKQELGSAIDVDDAINAYAAETLRKSGLADQPITLKPSVFKNAISKEVVLPILQKMMNSLPESARPPLARAIEAISEGKTAVATVSDLDVLRRALNSIAEKSPENRALFESANTLTNIIEKQAKGYRGFLDNYSLAKEAATGFAKFKSAFGNTPDIMKYGAQVAEAKQQVIEALGPRGQMVVEAIEKSMAKLSKMADEANTIKAAAEAAKTSKKTQAVGALRASAKSADEAALGVTEASEAAKLSAKAGAVAATRAANKALDDSVAAVRDSTEAATRATREASRSAARGSVKSYDESVAAINESAEAAKAVAKAAAVSATRESGKSLDASIAAISEAAEAAKATAKASARGISIQLKKSLDKSIVSLNESLEAAKDAAKAAALAASRQAAKSSDENIAAIKASGTRAKDTTEADAKEAIRQITRMANKEIDDINKILADNKQAVDAVDQILTRTTGRFDAAVKNAKERGDVNLGNIARGSIADAAGESVGGAIRTTRALSEGAVGQRLKTVMSPEEADAITGIGRTQYKAAKNVAQLPTQRPTEKVIPAPGALALDAIGGAAGRPGPGYKVQFFKRTVSFFSQFGIRGNKAKALAEAVVMQDDAAIKQIIKGIETNKKNVEQAVNVARGAFQAGRQIGTDAASNAGQRAKNIDDLMAQGYTYPQARERQQAIDDLVAVGYSLREAKEMVAMTDALDQ